MFFLLNNLVLVLICVVIFWGTFFPLISEALTGTEESVGPPFFNGIIAPIALVLVALSGDRAAPDLAAQHVDDASARVPRPARGRPS